MKKTLLTLLTIALTAVGAHAQDWKMVITKADGTQMELMTNEINNITYVQAEAPVLPDQNVDQILIKELYNGGCTNDAGKSFQYDKCVILYKVSGDIPDPPGTDTPYTLTHKLPR